MPEDGRDPFSSLERYLMEKALGLALLTDFLSAPPRTPDPAPAPTTTEDEDR